MKKVLFIQTASLGDVILATATAQSVRTLDPDIQIHFLVKAECAEVLQYNPVVDQVIVWNKKQHKYRNLFKTLLKVRGNKYDVVINFQRFFSSGLITAFSKGNLKAGFKKNPLSFLFNRRIAHSQSGIHEVSRNTDLANLCFENLKDCKPVIASIEPEFSEARALGAKRFITVFPGSLWQTKQFPLQGWIEFMRNIPEDLAVVLLGSKADSAFANDIRNARPFNSFNFCGQLSVLQSAWMMKHALMNFTNDSAPTHMASAVNAPVATIFCSTVPSFGFTPLSTDSHIIETNEMLNCRPCGVHGFKKCPLGHFNCGHGINIKQLTELLNYES